VIRYRRRGDELPTQTHGNNRLELTWTVIPTVIVLVLFVLTLQAQDKVLDQSGEADVNVTVTAFQWSYRFTYEGTGAEVVGSPEHIPEMVVPVGQTIRVKLISADVVHTFYVPQTLFKRQAIPGTDNFFDLTFEKEGLYHGQCTQFCGLQHPDMTYRVRVVNQGQYQSWLADATRRGAAGQPGT
jgi:cytochrome c oxidase subunit II